MYPFWWNETITLYRRRRDEDASGKTITTWERETVHNCFWSTTLRQTLNSTELTYQSTFVIRIPSVQCSMINKGDIAVKGAVCNTITSVSDFLKQHPEAFVINTAKDNSKLPHSHYYGSDI